ncbi:histone-lysine N-methyltransferase ATXR4 isoform X1 [Beta vulgaris subsp. vulgaris]|uniref:histone-lysine N-methyltransferase ATXR4 isoform X1 n=1 Tax=Beta vulgaris subsp. vulgaris TaxID=3555 RepID=UPI00054016CA|nr:histone-lysine N-methyltransferase ATXR4 isoform X1 [Beta vulgaris subsp. vulgaris]
MSSLLRTSRYLFPQLKLLISPTNPLLKISISTISTTNNVREEKSQAGPPPIQVGITETAGRAVFATRKIGASELIHTAKPIISHPSLTKIGSVCYLCLKRLKPEAGTENNSRIRVEPFCTEECRQQAKAYYEIEKKADWSAYHKYCRTSSLKYPLLVKRLACMVIAGAASADCIHILQPAPVLPETEVEYSMLRSAFEGINMAEENFKFLSEQWYADVLARIRINAFRIEMVAGSYDDLLTLAAASVEAEAGVGNAVYILPSFYNHDCDPNVHIIWMDSVHARLKALRDIEEGEELRICYIDASMDHNARQSILLGGFGFKCSCHRCLSGD